MSAYLKKCCFFILLLGSQPGWTQDFELGLPLLDHYTKADYQAGTQSWDFAQDEQGRLFIANNEGLLCFDGIHWRCYPLPNRTIVRSVALWQKNRVLVGGQNEWGYFEPNTQGQLVFHSLKELLPVQLQDFADVWDIIVQGEQIYVRTSQHLFLLDGQTVVEVSTQGENRFLAEWEGKVWVQVAGQGLATWQGASLDWVIPAEVLGDKLITGILPAPNPTFRLATFDDGLWQWDGQNLTPWATSNQAFFRTNQVGTTCPLPDGRIALGTSWAGVAILDQSGQLELVMDVKNGLQDNNVLALFLDQAQQLWAGLNYGIDRLDIASPYTRIYPDAPLNGTAYAALQTQDRLYLGTSTGLYTRRLGQPYDLSARSGWQLVPGTQGQVWGLQQIGSQIWMGHHLGAFLIEGTQARRVPQTEGIWGFLPLPGSADRVIAGSYQGLLVLGRGASGYQVEQSIEGFSESSRFIVPGAQAGEFWVSHPYRGIFRLQLSEQLELEQVVYYGKAEGLPSTLFNHVFCINEEVVVASETGIYQFDSAAQRWLPHPDFTEAFPPDTRIIRLQEDPQGNLWFITEQEVGVFWIQDRGLRKSILREDLSLPVNSLVGGFELLRVSPEQDVIIGLEKGFLHYHPRRKLQSHQPWQALVSAVFLPQDLQTPIYGGFSPAPQPAFRFASDTSAFRFDCGATYFRNPEKLRFRYRMRGLETQWSDWTARPIREYTNLSAGDYTFEVQARNHLGELSKIDTFAFTVLPPWYATPQAKVLYGLLVLAFLVSLILVPRHKFEQEKAELRSAHQREQAVQQEVIQETKSQLSSLQREKFEAELQHQAQQLATATLHLVQKNEAISNLRLRVEQLLKRHPDHPGQQELKQALRELSQEERFEEDWQQFAAHFDQVHGGFLRRLQEEYPQLTPKDTRLCAYLRMNLSTKEIAPLMNISVRGVEISRYRLRKKLDLAKEVNLNEFMMNF